MKTIVAGLSSDAICATGCQSLEGHLIEFAAIEKGITMNTRGAMHQPTIAAIDPMIARICVRTVRPIQSDSQATRGK